MANKANKIEKEWTIMVYMAGDNNLSIDMAYALNDIKGVAFDMKGLDGIGSANINLLVYYDSSANDVPTLYCDFTDCHNPQFTRASGVKKEFTRSNASEESSNPFDENSAAMYSVMNFVNWCVKQVEFEEGGIQKGRKAKNYAMIFSGHGFGFQSITFLKDNNSNYYMTIRKLRASLEEIRDKIIGQELAILGFDSCVMSMLEVGNELKDVAKTMIASEGTIPNAGWAYEPILKGLINSKITSDDDIFEVSKGIVRNFIKTQEQFAVGGVSVDLSAWDLNKVEPVVTAVNKLGEILLKGLKDESAVRQLELILLKCHFKSQSFMFEQNVDLVDFCEILIDETKLFDKTIMIGLDDNGQDELKPLAKTLMERCNDVIETVKDCVLLNGFSGGKFQYSNGISIFFPWTYFMFLLSAKTYDNLRFVFFEKGIYWRNFLFHYLGEVSLRDRSRQIGCVVESVESKTTENPKTRTTENPRTRTTENPKTRTTENPKTRLVEDLAGVRTTENPRTRTTENPGTRTTENPKTRMLDAMSPYLYDFKNVATPWFVAGLNEQKIKQKYKNENNQKKK